MAIAGRTLFADAEYILSSIIVILPIWLNKFAECAGHVFSNLAAEITLTTRTVVHEMHEQNVMITSVQ